MKNPLTYEMNKILLLHAFPCSRKHYNTLHYFTMYISQVHAMSEIAIEMYRVTVRRKRVLRKFVLTTADFIFDADCNP